MPDWTKKHELDGVDRKILAFFNEYQRRYGVPPTIREVLEAISELNSTSSVKYRLDRLVRKGLLERHSRDHRAARSYALPQTASPEGAMEPVVIPVLGYITASGQETVVFVNDMPVLSMDQVIQQVDPENVEDVLVLDEPPFGIPGNLDPRLFFALRVQGTSMQDRGILPGDVVIFRRIHEPPPRHTLVAVRVDDWLTLKEFRGVENGQVVLQPANQAEGLQPIYVPADQVHFEGQARWVIRAL